MPKAIPVIEDNITFIVEYAKALGFNLDYIRDTMEYNAEDGYVTYLITDGTSENNNVTFTEMIEPDFNHNWDFTEQPSLTEFVNIERV